MDELMRLTQLMRLEIPGLRLEYGSGSSSAVPYAVYEICIQMVGDGPAVSVPPVVVLSAWRRWSVCAAFARAMPVAFKCFPSSPADFFCNSIEATFLERRRAQLEEYFQGELGGPSFTTRPSDQGMRSQISASRGAHVGAGLTSRLCL